MGGRHCWRVVTLIGANVAPGAPQLVAKAHEILSFPVPNMLKSNPERPAALSHLWKLVGPAQHIGRGRKLTEQTALPKLEIFA